MYRFALSPMKDMHIGDLRIALLIALCAQKNNQRFHVRIEDTPKASTASGKDQEILHLLSLFGIGYDGLTYQSENLKFHHQLAATLLAKGKAFSCFCTPEALQAKQKEAEEKGNAYRYDGTCEYLSDMDVLANQSPFTVRIKYDAGSFVLLGYDKTPTHIFATAVDDMLQGVKVVLCETPAQGPQQEHIRQSLGFTEPIHYLTVPPLVTPQEEPLGENTPLVQTLLDQGFLPQAIANYLLLLSLKTPCEVFTLDQALTWFDAHLILPSSVPFSMEKLRQLNREHLLAMDDAALAGLLDFSGADFGKLAKLYVKEAATLGEIKPKLHAIFAPKTAPKNAEASFERVQEALLKAPHFDTLDGLAAHLCAACALEKTHLLSLLRVLLSGAEEGPELGALYAIINPYLKEIVRS